MAFLRGLDKLRYTCFGPPAPENKRRLVTAALLKAGVRAMSLQPAASAVCRGGKLLSLSTAPIKVWIFCVTAGVRVLAAGVGDVRVFLLQEAAG